MHFVTDVRGERRRKASRIWPGKTLLLGKRLVRRHRGRGATWSSSASPTQVDDRRCRALQRSAGAAERPDRRLRHRRLVPRAQRGRGGGNDRTWTLVSMTDDQVAETGQHAAGDPGGHLSRPGRGGGDDLAAGDRLHHHRDGRRHRLPADKARSGKTARRWPRPRPWWRGVTPELLSERRRASLPSRRASVTTRRRGSRSATRRCEAVSTLAEPRRGTAGRGPRRSGSGWRSSSGRLSISGMVFWGLVPNLVSPAGAHGAGAALGAGLGPDSGLAAARAAWRWPARRAWRRGALGRLEPRPRSPTSTASSRGPFQMPRLGVRPDPRSRSRRRGGRSAGRCRWSPATALALRRSSASTCPAGFGHSGTAAAESFLGTLTLAEGGPLGHADRGLGQRGGDLRDLRRGPERGRGGARLHEHRQRPRRGGSAAGRGQGLGAFPRRSSARSRARPRPTSPLRARSPCLPWRASAIRQAHRRGRSRRWPPRAGRSCHP